MYLVIAIAFKASSRLSVHELMHHIHKTARIEVVKGKTCYVSCILSHATSYIDQYLVDLPVLHYQLLSPIKVKHEVENSPLLFRIGLGAQSRTLTDVSVMVMTKSGLYQTQHSGLTITAIGHICHGTKNRLCEQCVFCVCIFLSGLWFTR